jgi:hypothetical protein
VNIGHEMDGKNQFYNRPVLIVRKFRTIRLKARIVFTLKVVIMLWWAFGVTHRPT